MTPQQMWEVCLIALCNWREARDQLPSVKLAQAWSVRNRVLHPGWWGDDWVSVILKFRQYSSFNANDPNAVKMPLANEQAWLECLGVAYEVWQGHGDDPVAGATHYFDKSLDSNPPKWATDSSMTHTIDLGAFHFYRPA